MNLAIALSAIAISVISLFVAVEHGRTEEKLVAANSWPFRVRRGLITQNAPVGVLPARDGIDIMAWRELAGNAAIWARLDDARHRIKMEACYCSVLDDCWTSDLTPTAQPAHVDVCNPITDGYAG